MGKWAEKNHDQEFLKKFKSLFSEMAEQMKKDQPESEFSFEDFVESFDVNDRFQRHLFSFVIKQTEQKYRRRNLREARMLHSPGPSNLSRSRNRLARNLRRWDDFLVESNHLYELSDLRLEGRLENRVEPAVRPASNPLQEDSQGTFL